MAEKLLRSEFNTGFPELVERVEIASAGIMPQAYLKWAAGNGLFFRIPYYGKLPGPAVIRFLARRGFDVSSYRSRALDDELLDQADLIVAMDHSVQAEILTTRPQAADRVAAFRPFLLGDRSASSDIGDPFRLPHMDQVTGEWDMDDEYEVSYCEEIERILHDHVGVFARFIKGLLQ